MGKLDNIKNGGRNLPEFSEKNFTIVGYVVGSLITLSGLFFIYEILFVGDLTFKPQWNMFKSPLGSICLFIGLLWAMAWWGKFTHWSATPITKTYDRYGNLKKVEEDYDISNQMLYKLALPFLGHFIIEPIIYGAIIYYPIQCIIAVVGAIFPYVLTLLVLGIIALSWMSARISGVRYHSYLLVLAGLLFTVAFAWGGYAIGNNEPGSTIQMLTDTQQVTESTDDAVVDESISDDDTETSGMEDDTADQFEGYGEEGLLGSLPLGITVYTGDMEGFPIEFTINNEETSSISAVYKNLKYNSTINLEGESLPADGGDINFYGKDNDADWVFHLTGDADNITGTAQSGDNKLTITLHRK